MTHRGTVVSIGLSVAFAVTACARIIGIEDLPPLEQSDAGLPGQTPGPDIDAMQEPLDDLPALASLSVSGIASAITLMPGVSEYTVHLPLSQMSVTVTATVSTPADTVTIAGEPCTSGIPSEPISLDLGDNPVDIVVERSADVRRAYRLILRRADELAQYAYGKASNTDASDQFGYSIAVSGDILAIGAYGEASAATGVDANQEDDAASGSGAVYVFRRSGSNWQQEAYLKASNTEALDRFGGSVALSGDTLAVGAWGEDSAATGMDGNQVDNSVGDSGAVYVFRRTGTAWQQEAYLKASNTGARDWFGHSVALSGDTLAVGAWIEDSAARGVGGNQDDDSMSESGAVYVFRRSGTAWQQEAYLKAFNTEAFDRFGASVSLSSDTLAVGAWGEDSAAMGVDGDQADNSARDSGAVYLFRRSGTVWQQEAYLKASNTGPYDEFGSSVALSDDTLAIGAHLEDSAATGVNGSQDDDSISGSGAVYVFRRSGTVWQQEAYLKASNTGGLDEFGYSAALLGDTLAIGAPLEASAATGVNGNQADDFASGRGAVYVFRRGGSVWQQEAYLKASNISAGAWNVGDRFGHSVAVSADTVAIGAHLEASAATGINGNPDGNSAVASGAVYIFH